MSSPLDASRLIALTDGVVAVVITIMVLEFATPHGADLSDLLPLLPTFLTYVLSFVVVGIYWNNHHHLLRATRQISAGVMWANLHLLFWLSLIPFVTGWLGEHLGQSWPTVVYGLVCLLTAGAYQILVWTIVRVNRGHEIGRRIGRDVKGFASLTLYVLGCLVAAWAPYVGVALFACVAILWFVPDRRLVR